MVTMAKLEKQARAATQAVFDHYGGKAATARALGLTRGAVTYWGEYIPENAAINIENETEGKFTVHDLRPDLFPYRHA